MILLTLAAGAACCAALWAGFVVLTAGRAEAARAERPVAASPPPRPLPGPGSASGSREEDRVLPAVDASGARIWLEQDDVFWHEIVCWPARRTSGADTVRPAGVWRGA